MANTWAVVRFRSERIGNALRIIGVNMPSSPRKSQGRIQQQSRGKGVGVVDGKHMGRGSIRAAFTGIGEIPEAVKAAAMAPLLRVLHARQILLAEAVVDPDIELI